MGTLFLRNSFPVVLPITKYSFWENKNIVLSKKQKVNMDLGHPFIFQLKSFIANTFSNVIQI